MWDNVGRNIIRLDQAEYIEMGPLTSDYRFNTTAHAVRSGTKSLSDWLADVWIQRWPTVNELKLPDIPWVNVNEGINRVRELGMVEWIHHLNSSICFYFSSLSVT